MCGILVKSNQINAPSRGTRVKSMILGVFGYWVNPLSEYSPQGRSQDLGGGGARIVFFRFRNLHVATCSLLGGFGGMPTPPRKLFKMVSFGEFWCVFRSDFAFKIFQKLSFFLCKK